MSKAFKTTKFVLSADVANAGTFTVSYPSGYDDGNFERGVGHYIMLNGAKLNQPKEIGLSFGTSSVTVTNRTGGTLPALSSGIFQFEIVGEHLDQFARGDNQTVAKPIRAQKLHPVLIDLGSPLLADADGVSASQSVDADASFLLNGALLANSQMIFDVPRNVVAAWTTTAILTITGKDQYGRTMVETTASGTSHTGKKAFKEITSVTSNASITGATVGTGVILGLPFRVENQDSILAELENGVTSTRLQDNVRVPFAISEAEMDAATSVYVVPGFAGTVLGMTTVVGDTITTGGTLTVNIGATPVTGLGVVIADGSSAGDVDTDVGTGAAATFTATQALTIVGDAAFNASGRVTGYIDCRRTTLLNGTFVGGLTIDTKSLSTSADVCGTYSPVTAPDGSINYQLLALVADPNFVGSQYAG